MTEQKEEISLEKGPVEEENIFPVNNFDDEDLDLHQ